MSPFTDVDIITSWHSAHSKELLVLLKFKLRRNISYEFDTTYNEPQIEVTKKEAKSKTNTWLENKNMFVLFDKQLAELGTNPEWSIHVHQAGGFVALGVALKSTAEKRGISMHMFPFSSTGHGAWIIASNYKYVGASNDDKYNNYNHGFTFIAGHTVDIKYDSQQQKLVFKRRDLLETVELTNVPREAYPCIAQHSIDDYVTIIS
jgi:hypothetical protein